MEVILLEDVKSLGKKGELVKVNDGYARNFILPKNLGVEATPKNLNELKIQKKKEEKEAEEILNEAKEYAKKIEAKPVKLTMKIGEGGRTFGAVSSKEIATGAKQQLGLDIDKKKMKLEESIKTLGTYDIPVKLHKEVTATLKVIVTEE